MTAAENKYKFKVQLDLAVSQQNKFCFDFLLVLMTQDRLQADIRVIKTSQ